jgi:arylsulfatase A-like enzyme
MNTPITRRNFLRNSALSGAGLLLLRSGLVNAYGSPANPPNIVMLVFDDEDIVNSPFLDAMAVLSSFKSSGAWFTTCISPTPISSPARCTLLTGRLAHNTGVYTLSGNYGPGNFQGSMADAFPAKLQNAGYTTGFIGKPWGATTSIDPGWSFWSAWGGSNFYTGTSVDVTEVSLAGKSSSYTQTTSSYGGSIITTDFMSDKAYAFLQATASNTNPFFLLLTPTAPHLPLPPATRHQAYAQATWQGQLDHTPNYNEPDVSDKSNWLISQAATRSESVPYADQEYWWRMGSLMAVDEMIGRIRDTLVAQGKWANTVLIVTSDHGYNLGSHRLIHKMAPYDESIRIPLFIMGPGIQPCVINRIVGSHDLAPTILDLAGIAAPIPAAPKGLGLSRDDGIGQRLLATAPVPTDSFDGKSLVPFLRSGSNSGAPFWRHSIITAYVTGGVNAGYQPSGTLGAAWKLDIPTYTSIRTDTNKYVYWSATGEEEVYDLVNDPYENYNLLKTYPGTYTALRATLAARMNVEVALAGPNCP